jgi:hypothetical protein
LIKSDDVIVSSEEGDIQEISNEDYDEIDEVFTNSLQNLEENDEFVEQTTYNEYENLDQFT